MFTRTKQCESVLFELKLNLISRKKLICYRCGSNNFSYNKKNYIFRCKKCKTKISIKYNTIFHNVRFGLLKAFKIVMNYDNPDYLFSSTKVAREFKITQKTAWKFLDKIKNNEYQVIELICNINEIHLTSKSNMKKIQDYKKD